MTEKRIHAVLTAATAILHLSDSPRLDAEILLSHLLSVRRSHLFAWPDTILTSQQYTQFQTLITRRAQNEPIAYLIGHKEFWSLRLQVTENTLVPRPDTELLVEQSLARLPLEQQTTVIDLGTGSGAIALAIAYERPLCHVLATDKSGAALSVAQKNAHQLGLSVDFLCSDWYSHLDDQKATLIVSNPPYIAKNDPHLKQLQYEPLEALVSGQDGLTDIRYLIAHASAHLRPQGFLLLEHADEQAESVQALFQQYAYTAIHTYQDLAGLDRVTVGQL
ncbi:MAG: peptide chain release factor N(5)-glutamine methyltransferase [Thiomargarita sp.]|nr:peptide chain release factor N(5)-glutamine methyltransferase [Thiomargarita sp.]